MLFFLCLNLKEETMSKINYEDLKYKLERCKNVSINEIERDIIPELSELKIAKKKN